MTAPTPAGVLATLHRDTRGISGDTDEWVRAVYARVAAKWWGRDAVPAEKLRTLGITTPCYVTRSHLSSRCFHWIGTTVAGETWTGDMCCLPCRLLALVAEAEEETAHA